MGGSTRMSVGTRNKSSRQGRKGSSETRQVLALVGAVVLVAGGIGGAGIYNSLSARAEEQQRQQSPAPEAVSASPVCEVLDRAGLVPAAGALFGVNLDWHAKPLAKYAADLGHKPTVSVSFTGFPYTAQEKADLQRAVEQIRAYGQMMLLTLEPMTGLSAVTPESADALAKDLAEFNADGVPVIVRFAHEMNGSWYPWSQQPDLYIEAFQTIAKAVHTHAPGTAMMCTELRRRLPVRRGPVRSQNRHR